MNVASFAYYFVRLLVTLQKEFILSFFKRASKRNKYLEGNFAPVPDELTAESVYDLHNHTAEGSLNVIGSVPSELQGEFLRTGPNPQYLPSDPTDYHWFDGDGMIHAVQIFKKKSTSSNNKEEEVALRRTIRYLNRYVQTERFKKEKAAGKAVYPRLGGFLKSTSSAVYAVLSIVLSKVFAAKRDRTSAGTANTALAWHTGNLLALVESDVPYLVDPVQLSTLKRHDYGGELKHPFTAHPKKDFLTGELIFFCYYFDRAVVTYRIVSKEGRLVHSFEFPVSQPVMMHDFAITETHTIFMVFPLVFSLKNLAVGGPMLYFDATIPSRFAVMKRYCDRVEDIQWFETKSCYAFHVMNSYNLSKDEILLRACRSRELLPTLFQSHLQLEAPLSNTAATPAQKQYPFLYSWKFNLRTGKLEEKEEDTETSTEFPVVLQALTGRAHRFGYAATFLRSDLEGDASLPKSFQEEDYLALFDGAVKYDFVENKKTVIKWGKGKFGGECFYVPTPKLSEAVQAILDKEGVSSAPSLELTKGSRVDTSLDEDNGYLLTFVYDSNVNTSELWILNAKTMESEPLARVVLPRRVPFGFHSLWVSQEELQAAKLDI